MKRGFTLIELLAVIIILAVIGLIVVPVVGKVINNSQKEVYEQQVENLKRITDNYIVENDREYSLSKKKVSFQTLISNGYLNEKDAINPSTEEQFKGCMEYYWNDIEQEFIVEYNENCVFE